MAKSPARRKDNLIPLHFRYRDVYGISRRKTVYGKALKEAQQKKDAFLADVKAALRIDQAARTVSSWADEWLAVYKKPTVSILTYETYAHDVKLIKDAVGDKPLRAVTTADIQRVVNSRKGLSNSVIRKTMMTAKALFQAAVENRLISVNPCIGLRAVPGTTGTHKALGKEEVAAILQTALNHRFGGAVALMLLAGLRRGEAAAFNFDTDAGDGKLTVSRATTWVNNQPVIKEPKSRAGLRTIPILPPLDKYLGKGLALPGKDGYISETGFVRAYESFVKACGVKFRCHDLRHTFATLLFDAGVDVKTAQLWLGHDDPTVTMRIYTHLSQSRLSDATKDAEAYFQKQVAVKLAVNETATPEKTSLLP